MSGSVPLPIEPKPIMTMGPSILPCTGQVVMECYSEGAGRTGGIGAGRAAKKRPGHGNGRPQPGNDSDLETTYSGGNQAACDSISSALTRATSVRSAGLRA